MNDFERRGEPDPLKIDLNYADSAANVRARFNVYTLAEPYVDIDRLAIDTLKQLGRLPINASILDVGTADAALYPKLAIDYGHQGTFYGIDRKANQFRHLTNLGFSADELRRLSLRHTDPVVQRNFEALRNLQEREEVQSYLANNLVLREGQADNLHEFPDGSIDILFAMNMLYHVPTSARMQTYDEFKRVVKPDGTFMISTSGITNKQRHRELEAMVAERLGVNPPQIMNASFTSEQARVELPEHFNYVYMRDDKYDKSEMRITDLNGFEKYLRSQRSLFNQYNPVPDAETFEIALIDIVMREIMKEIGAKGVFTDTVHRSLVICSNEPILGADTHNFALIK